MLGITTDENWKAFAKHLGFTKHEIRNRLSSTTDPFALIMGAFQARGGKLFKAWLLRFTVSCDLIPLADDESRGLIKPEL